MRTQIRTLSAALLLCLPLLACSNDPSAAGAKSGQDEPGFIARAAREATDKARDELAKNDIDLDADGQPKAAITPKGELLIDGKPVAMNDAQRKLALDYRAGVTAIAEAGIDIGLQGADLAGKAVTEALAGVFSGKSDEVEKRIEHHAEGIKASAVKLCTKLPALLDAQNRLAEAVPEFKPYASMTQGDIDDCGKDGNVNLDLPGVHVNTDDGDSGHAGSTAAEAEAAAGDSAKK